MRERKQSKKCKSFQASAVGILWHVYARLCSVAVMENRICEKYQSPWNKAAVFSLEDVFVPDISWHVCASMLRTEMQSGKYKFFLWVYKEKILFWSGKDSS